MAVGPEAEAPITALEAGRQRVTRGETTPGGWKRNLYPLLPPPHPMPRLLVSTLRGAELRQLVVEAFPELAGGARTRGCVELMPDAGGVREALGLR